MDNFMKAVGRAARKKVEQVAKDLNLSEDLAKEMIGEPKIQGLEFFLPFEPVAWERARACGKRFFTAPKSAAYKRSLINFLDRNKKHFAPFFYIPLSVEMTFALRKPMKPKFSTPAVRPDLDNYSKAVLDAMNEICFKDDGQVVRLILNKVYVFGEPGTNIIIKAMEEA